MCVLPLQRSTGLQLNAVVTIFCVIPVCNAGV